MFESWLGHNPNSVVRCFLQDSDRIVHRLGHYRYSVFGIATGYGLDGRGVGVPSPGEGTNFLYVVQTGSGTQLASYPMGTGALSPGVKRPGREVDHSPPN
jgi:hypothetical protein